MTIPLGLDSKASADSIRMALGQKTIKPFFDLPVELLQKNSNDLNRSRRELFLDGTLRAINARNLI